MSIELAESLSASGEAPPFAVENLAAREDGDFVQSPSHPTPMNTTATFVLRNDLPASGTVELPQVIRRDLQGDASGKPRVVPWLGHKIAKAVAAACFVEGQAAEIGRQVQAEIEYRMRRERPSFVHIEQLQDMVEETLIDIGQAKVALAYGKYRARRAAEREIGVAPGGDAGQQLELATREQLADIRARLSFAKIGLKLMVSDDDLVARLLRSTSLNLTAEERRDTIVLNAKSLLDLDPDARFFSARILLSYIYEETLPWKIADGPHTLKEAHRRAFVGYIPKGIALRRLDPRLAEFDLEKLAAALDPFADLQFDFIGIQNLFDRYLIHSQDGVTGRKRRLEAPQIFWLRVAMGLSVLEKEREPRAIEFYGIYKSRRACSSTPTLFNAGAVHPQLPSCYLLYCGDSIEEITETWRRFSHLSKWAGGTRLLVDGHPRGRRSHSRNQRRKLRRHPVSQGVQRHRHRRESRRQAARRPVQLSRTLARRHRGLPRFAQGDRRRPAAHPQYEHRAVDSRPVHEAAQGHLRWGAAQRRGLDSLPHKRRARPSGALWTRFRGALRPLRGSRERRQNLEPKGARAHPVEADARNAFRNRSPVDHFQGPCNLRSPQDHAGVIHNSNLCTEITLNTSKDEVAVCNLASINLAAHLREDGALDHDKLRATITVLMRMLDNVIDINFYPVEAAARANQRHRPVRSRRHGHAGRALRQTHRL